MTRPYRAAFDVAFEGGFSLGTWASNVNFGDTSMEWDLYVGWSGEISDGMELGVQLIHFQYPNDTELNYQEAAVSLSFGDFSVGVNYSPEYLAAPNETFFYPYASYSYSLTEAHQSRLLRGVEYRQERRFLRGRQRVHTTIR